MTNDTENLLRDLATIRAAAVALRQKTRELADDEIAALLPVLRACAAELIALRSTMDREKAKRTEQRNVKA
jgi:hypothetical protein